MTNYHSKTRERDRRRPLFLLSGLLFASGLTLLSFEYKTERRISEKLIPLTRTLSGNDVIAMNLKVPEPPEAPARQVRKTILQAGIMNIRNDFFDDPEPDHTPVDNTALTGIVDIDGQGTELPPDDLSPVEYYELPEFTATFADCRDVEDRQERLDCTQQKLSEYIASNVTFYPYLYERGVGGVAEVSFIIDAGGQVRDVEVLTSVHRDLDSQVVKALRQMKPWAPARQGNHIVVQKFRTTVNFQR